MRTHRTVYRVLNADGTEAYRGKRSAVIRWLRAKQRVNIFTMTVVHGRYEPVAESGPTSWKGRVPADLWLARNDGPDNLFRDRSNP